MNCICFELVTSALTLQKWDHSDLFDIPTNDKKKYLKSTRNNTNKEPESIVTSNFQLKRMFDKVTYGLLFIRYKKLYIYIVHTYNPIIF